MSSLPEILNWEGFPVEGAEQSASFDQTVSDAIIVAQSDESADDASGSASNIQGESIAAFVALLP